MPTSFVSSLTTSKPRAVHVQTLIRLLDRVPLFASKPSGREASLLEKAMLTSVVLFFIHSFSLRGGLPSGDIAAFLHSVDRRWTLLMSCCFIWYVWRAKDDAVSARDIEQFDSRFGVELGDTSDIYAVCWLTFLLVFWCAQLAANVYVFGSITILIRGLAWIMLNNAVSHMLLLKYMLAKRLQALRPRSPLGCMPAVRALLDMNDSLNEFHSPLVFVWCSEYLMDLVLFPSYIWYAVVLEYEESDFIPLFNGCWILLLVVLHHSVMFCWSSVGVQVDALVLEVDRRLSESPEPHRERLLVWVQELRLATGSTEPSGVDLFSVDCDSLTSALALFLNAMMLIIQLT